MLVRDSAKYLVYLFLGHWVFFSSFTEIDREKQGLYVQWMLLVTNRSCIFIKTGYLLRKTLLAFQIAIYIWYNIEVYFFKHFQFRLFTKLVMVGPSEAFMLDAFQNLYVGGAESWTEIYLLSSIWKPWKGHFTLTFISFISLSLNSLFLSLLTCFSYLISLLDD